MQVVPGVVENLKVITRAASQRIAEYAFKYAQDNGRKVREVGTGEGAGGGGGAGMREAPGVRQATGSVVAPLPARLTYLSSAPPVSPRAHAQTVSAVHKATIHKLGDGLFLECCREAAKAYPAIAYEVRCVCACAWECVTGEASAVGVLAGWRGAA